MVNTPAVGAVTCIDRDGGGPRAGSSRCRAGDRSRRRRSRGRAFRCDQVGLEGGRASYLAEARQVEAAIEAFLGLLGVGLQVFGADREAPPPPGVRPARTACSASGNCSPKPLTSIPSESLA